MNILDYKLYGSANKDNRKRLLTVIGKKPDAKMVQWNNFLNVVSEHFGLSTAECRAHLHHQLNEKLQLLVAQDEFAFLRR